jgi:hypothetical protein
MRPRHRKEDQIIPTTTAARKPKDMIAAKTFSRILSSIVASYAGGVRLHFSPRRVARHRLPWPIKDRGP